MFKQLWHGSGGSDSDEVLEVEEDDMGVEGTQLGSTQTRQQGPYSTQGKGKWKSYSKGKGKDERYTVVAEYFGYKGGQADEDDETFGNRYSDSEHNWPHQGGASAWHRLQWRNARNPDAPTSQTTTPGVSLSGRAGASGSLHDLLDLQTQQLNSLMSDENFGNKGKGKAPALIGMGFPTADNWAFSQVDGYKIFGNRTAGIYFDSKGKAKGKGKKVELMRDFMW